MAINPYTLMNLYNQGIIDYVPSELCTYSPMGAMNGSQYLNSAMQGNLYQKYGMCDSFTSSNNLRGNLGVSGMNNSGAEYMGIGGIGTNSPSGLSFLGFSSDIGSHSQTGGVNALGAPGIGTQSQAGGFNAIGGITDVEMGVANAVDTVSKTPTILKALGAIGMIGVSLYLLFRHKKAPEPKQGFWARLFGKKPEPKPEPKQGFWSRIFGRKKK